MDVESAAAPATLCIASPFITVHATVSTALTVVKLAVGIGRRASVRNHNDQIPSPPFLPCPRSARLYLDTTFGKDPINKSKHLCILRSFAHFLHLSISSTSETYPRKEKPLPLSLSPRVNRDRSPKPYRIPSQRPVARSFTVSSVESAAILSSS